MNPRFKQTILDHLWGPTGSIILHIIIIVVLIKFVTFIREGNAPDVEVMMMEIESVDLEDLEELQKEIDDLDMPDVDVDVPTDVPEPDMVEQETFEEDVDTSQLDVLSEINSPLIMQGLFKGRSASGRSAMLRRFGASPEVEKAVNRALEWLKKHQKPDGSWGSKPTGLTGLALLTFLAHGETPSSEKYGATVEKGIKYLLKQMQDNGRFKSKDQHGSYSHGIATYALGEAYALTRIPAIKPVLDQAVKHIVDGQQAGGGWDYNYAKGARRDTSVCAWQAQALKAAYLAGSDTPGIKQAMRRCIRDMKSHFVPGRGMFTYTSGGGSMSTTGGGCLSMQLLGASEEQEVTQAVDFLSNRTCDYNNPDTNNALYAWYYSTQDHLHHGGSAWTSWNKKFQAALLGSQQADGHWEVPGGGQKQHNYGPEFNTTLCALTLQVYYRHLPTFQEKAIEVEEFEEESTEDDVVIEIM